MAANYDGVSLGSRTYASDDSLFDSFGNRVDNPNVNVPETLFVNHMQAQYDGTIGDDVQELLDIDDFVENVVNAMNGAWHVWPNPKK